MERAGIKKAMEWRGAPRVRFPFYCFADLFFHNLIFFIYNYQIPTLPAFGLGKDISLKDGRLFISYPSFFLKNFPFGEAS